MTRETKVGMLVGLGLILLVGIIISDHLSIAQRQSPAAMTGYAESVEQSIHPSDPTVRPAPRRRVSESPAPSGERHDARAVVPTPEELSEERRSQPKEMPASPPASPQVRPTEPVRWAVDEPVSAMRVQTAALDGVSESGVGVGVGAGGEPEPEAARGGTEVSRGADGMRDGATGDQAAASSPAVARGAQDADVLSEPARQADEDRPRPAPVRVHVVAEGETLFTIAQRYYGDGSKWRYLAEHNAAAVKENGHVWAGTRLRIPWDAGQPTLGRDFIPAGLERMQRVSVGDGGAGASRAASGDGGRRITVEAGDTLIGLARRHLGDGERWHELLAANRDLLEEPTDLRVGMRLRLPGSARAAASVSERSAATARTPATYTVRPGDSLSRIAERVLGDRDAWQRLYDLNKDRLTSPDRVRVGQTLRLPS